MRKSKLFIGAALVVALVALGVGQSKIQEPSVAASNGVMAPHFLVDPYWPKPLPNNWAMGNTIGVDVDERDHVFIVHRNDASQFGVNTEIGLQGGVAECCGNITEQVAQALQQSVEAVSILLFGAQIGIFALHVNRNLVQHPRAI